MSGVGFIAVSGVAAPTARRDGGVHQPPRRRDTVARGHTGAIHVSALMMALVAKLVSRRRYLNESAGVKAATVVTRPGNPTYYVDSAASDVSLDQRGGLRLRESSRFNSGMDCAEERDPPRDWSGYRRRIGSLDLRRAS
jgi:hypothetical protein